MKKNQIKSQVLAAARGLLGPELTTRLLMARNFRHYRDRGLIFIHVPKCAGSSVSRALYGQSLGHHPAIKLRAHDAEGFAAVTSFAVLRDPVSRAYSAWQYARAGGTKEGWAADRPSYHEAEFANFEDFATKWLPAQDTESLDFVFQPQVDFVCDAAGAVIVDRLIPLSQLAESWASLVEGKRPASSQLGQRNVNKKAGSENRDISETAKAAILSYYARDAALFDETVRSSTG